jgi:hypothetical protein
MKENIADLPYQPIAAQLAYLHWSSGHDFRLSRVVSRQARETRVRFPDGEHILLFSGILCIGGSSRANGVSFSWSACGFALLVCQLKVLLFCDEWKKILV